MIDNKFIELLKSDKTIVSDGATGSNLFKRGLAKGPAEIWVLEEPEKIIGLHRDFIDSGADIILTCTFGGTALRLEQDGLGDKAVEINKRAVELAREAVEGTNVLVAGSIGPTGQLLKPLGMLDEDAAEKSFAGQAKTLIESGVDLLVIETQFDLGEATQAIRGARSSKSIPLVCSFSYDRGTRTMMGVKPSQMAEVIGELGVDVLGINCGHSLEDNFQALEELRGATDLPIWFKPNAGLPTVDGDDKPIYDTGPEAMGDLVPSWVQAGAKIIGGCCGTSPKHLHQIAINAKK